MVENQERAAEGVVDFIYKTFYGIFLSTALVILNNLINFFWGLEILEVYITITSSIFLAIYFTFKKFTNHSFIYLLGWVVGLIIIYSLDLRFFSLSFRNLIIWIILPTIILIVRYIIRNNKGDSRK